MKTCLLLAVCAVVLGVVLADAQVAQEKQFSRKVFFKDVPRAATLAAGPGLRIAHGDVATRTQFPYQVGLYLDYSAFCGGSLIHPKWVLTAAHCVDSFTHWAVFLGVSDMLVAKQEGRVVLLSNWAVRHEAYDAGQITNDIGVLQLPREVQLTEFIKLVKLAPAGVNYAGQKATVSGFGLVDDRGLQVISPVLRYTTLPIVSSNVCRKFYGSADISQICLEAEGTSSCRGDSGGPLTLNDTDGRTIQVGLTSFGCSGGCEVGCPVGFTRVNYFYDWISDKTGINFPL